MRWQSFKCRTTSNQLSRIPQASPAPYRLWRRRTYATYIRRPSLHAVRAGDRSVAALHPWLDIHPGAGIAGGPQFSSLCRNGGGHAGMQCSSPTLMAWAGPGALVGSASQLGGFWASGLPRTLARLKLLICNHLRSCRLTARRCRKTSRGHRSAFPMLILSCRPYQYWMRSRKKLRFPIPTSYAWCPGRWQALQLTISTRAHCPTVHPCGDGKHAALHPRATRIEVMLQHSLFVCHAPLALLQRGALCGCTMLGFCIVASGGRSRELFRTRVSRFARAEQESIWSPRAGKHLIRPSIHPVRSRKRKIPDIDVLAIYTYHTNKPRHKQKDQGGVTLWQEEDVDFESRMQFSAHFIVLFAPLHVPRPEYAHFGFP